MFRNLLTLLFILSTLFVQAQKDSTTMPAYRVSLITCGPGAEIYSVFGHSAIRVEDRLNGTDWVYNYGTFDGYEENFELKFMQGKLLYYLSVEDYNDFVDAYNIEGRWVHEQAFIADTATIQRMVKLLEQNSLPENRAYKYDFFFDNCATRIRDIIQKSYHNQLHFATVSTKDKPITYRQMINYYLRHNAWERLGINIVLGSKIDQVMSNEQIMFLPDYLEKAVMGAQYDGKSIVSATKIINDGEQFKYQQNYIIIIILASVILLFLLGFKYAAFQKVQKIISTLVLFLTGLLGLIILTMWFATDHQTCVENYNLLWALPTNLIYLIRKKKDKYALVAALLALSSFVVHLIGLQQLLLPEMALLVLLVILVFGNYYFSFKKNK